MAISVNPTFLLKGLDVKKVLADYTAGYFSRPAKEKSSIIQAPTAKILMSSYGTDGSSSIYTIKDRNNSNVIIATNNHRNFEFFTSSGGELPCGGTCKYCHRKYTTVTVGYPVEYQEKTLLVGDRYRIIYFFWVAGQFCSFGCALGHLQDPMSRPAAYRDSSVLDSIRQLYFLHLLMYPEKKLLPHRDPSLLASNEGSLTEEEWLPAENLAYVKSDRIVIMPAKNEFVRMNINPLLR